MPGASKTLPEFRQDSASKSEYLVSTQLRIVVLRRSRQSGWQSLPQIKGHRHMSRTKTFGLIGLLVAAPLICSLLSSNTNAGAQPSKSSSQQWQYATLFYDEPFTPAPATVVQWTEGAKILSSTYKEGQPDPFSKVYNDLGGTEEHATLGELLDSVGHRGWELVSHVRTESTARITQVWMFKRPAP
jgi:hypothetical protein